MSKRTSVVLLIALSLLVGLSALVSAAEDNRAAVVVAYGDGSVAARCVTFAEPDITGFELLERSGLELQVEDQSAGSIVCSIGGVGCPADDCFCQCRGGGDCTYWSYWHLSGADWVYSAAGASIFRISDGDVDGWSWGPGSVTNAIAPPAVSFADVCLADDATATMTPSVTATPLVVNTPALATDTAGVAATTTSQPTLAATTATTPLALAATPTSAVANTATVAPPLGQAPGSDPTPPSPSSATLSPGAPSEGGPAARPTQDSDLIAPGADSPEPDESVGVLAPGQSSDAIPPAPPQPTPERVPALGATPGVAAPKATSVDAAAVAVIGSGVAPEAQPRAVADAVTTATTSESVLGGWLPYLALGGMLLALGALVLVARRRAAAQGSGTGGDR